MLAKLVSGLHKPDDQTVLPPPVAAAFVAPLKPRCARHCSGRPASLHYLPATIRGQDGGVVTLFLHRGLAGCCKDHYATADDRHLSRTHRACSVPWPCKKNSLHDPASIFHGQPFGMALAERYPGSATRSTASCATWASRRSPTWSPPRGRRCCSDSGSEAATSCTSPAEPRYKTLAISERFSRVQHHGSASNEDYILSSRSVVHAPVRVGQHTADLLRSSVKLRMSNGSSHRRHDVIRLPDLWQDTETTAKLHRGGARLWRVKVIRSISMCCFNILLLFWAPLVFTSPKNIKAGKLQFLNTA